MKSFCDEAIGRTAANLLFTTFWGGIARYDEAAKAGFLLLHHMLRSLLEYIAWSSIGSGECLYSEGLGNRGYKLLPKSPRVSVGF